MDDKLLYFGEVTLGSEGAGYSANEVNFEVDSYDLSNLEDAILVVIANGAVTAAEISLYSGAATAPTTALHTYPTIAAMADGDRVELSLPLTCSQYLRVGGEGTGKIIAWIEEGGKSA